MKHIIVLLLLLTSCHARLSWSLPVESCYTEAAQAMAVLCEECTAPLMQSSAVSGAAILPTASGNYTIAYNRAQLQRIQRTYGRAAVLYIFAHEWGHVYILVRELTDTELEADMYAGCLLAMMGESTEPARRLLSAEARVDSEHPPVAQRIAALADGYNACNRLWR